ncbi:hypothetical protein [Streptomyces sp. NPDC048641]|uniref:hypothetical protein n=1 Tax=unclassified Streptomyces TaxID=2593676 RepID=UPI003428C1E4
MARTLCGRTRRGSRQIKGEVASVDEDAVVAIRCGTDILLVDFTATGARGEGDRPVKPSVGGRVEFTAPSVDVYPYSV